MKSQGLSAQAASRWGRGGGGPPHAADASRRMLQLSDKCLECPGPSAPAARAEQLCTLAALKARQHTLERGAARAPPSCTRRTLPWPRWLCCRTWRSARPGSHTSACRLRTRGCLDGVRLCFVLGVGLHGCAWVVFTCRWGMCVVACAGSRLVVHAHHPHVTLE